MLNLIPVITTILSFMVLSWGFFTDNFDVKKVGLAGFIFSGIMIIPVFFSGQTSEALVKTIPEISTVFLHEHKEAAYLSLWLTVILGSLSVIALILEKYKLSISKAFIAFLLIYSFITIASMSYTAYLGGNIRHTELLDTTIYENTNPLDNATVLKKSYYDTSDSYRY